MTPTSSSLHDSRACRMPPRRRRPARAAALAAAAALGLIAAAAPLGAANLIVNGEFSDGLVGWEREGSVAPLAGIAVVTDDGAPRSLLYQVASTNVGVHTLSFDFRNLVSPVVGEGAFPDTVFASLYLVSDIEAFDPVGGVGFEESVALFDADAGGVSNVVEGGSIGVSPEDGLFTRFALSFDNPLGLLVAVVIDLIDLNFVNRDSTVVIDRVQLEFTPPEPTAEMDSVGEFLRIRFNQALEVSEDLDPAGWERLEGAASPLYLLTLPDGTGEAEFRAVAKPGVTTPTISESEAFGMRRIEFTGALEYSIDGTGDEWFDVPAEASSPVFAVPGPLMRRLFRPAALE